jgi:hypothetical protein
MNPTLKKFLEEKPDITLIGLFWSMYWRWIAVLYAVSIVIMIAILGVSALFA